MKVIAFLKRERKGLRMEALNTVKNLLNDSEDQVRVLESLIENLPIPISVVSTKEQFVLVNKAYEEIFDIRREQLLGRHYSCHIRENERSIHRMVLQEKRPYSGTKVMGHQKRLVKVEGVPIFDNGRLAYSMGIIHEFSNTERTMADLEKLLDLKQSFGIEGARYSFEDILGDSEAQRKAVETARKAAATNVTILLRGESGTGKELFAHAIHNESARRNQKFVRVNCAAIPEDLLESILFGYEGGAFTGAKKGGEIGLFEAADKGTIFLDEIGDISLSLQAKLLRVLQEREITRVGGTKVHIINVRVIAATNADLEAKIARKEFRSDLYYRLNTFPVYIPSLRERTGDVAALAYHFLKRHAVEFGKPVRKLEDCCLRALSRHNWPGNVRELDNTIARAVIGLQDDRTSLRGSDIRFLLPVEEPGQTAVYTVPVDDPAADYQQRFQRWESEMLRGMYAEEGKNKTKMAKRLNISVRSVYEKLKKYEIE